MIQVREISKSFCSGRGEVRAITQISFTLPTAKTMVIAGKSGSGKTTLLNCIGGLEKPDSGTVHCLGLEISSLSGGQLSRFQRKSMGFVFQFSNLLSYLTVKQNIAFPLFLNNHNRLDREKRTALLLERIGLAAAGEAMPCELSGGELQRVAFARAIAHTPAILLADEPTASLDTESGLNLVQMMVALCREHGCTLIVATHDEDIVALADTTIHLRDGAVVNMETG